MLPDAGKGTRTSLQRDHPSEPPPFSQTELLLVYQWQGRATFVLTSPDICSTPLWTYSYSISSRNGDSNGDGDEDSISEPLTKNPLNRVRLSVEIVGKVYDGVCFQKEPSWPKDRMSAGGHSVNTAGLE
jgi:hypothetical protein